MSVIPKVSLKSDTVEVNAKPRPGRGADLLIRAEEIKGVVSLLGKYLHMWGEKRSSGGSAGDQKGRGAGRERGRGGGLAPMNFDFQPPAEVLGGGGRATPRNEHTVAHSCLLPVTSRTEGFGGLEEI